MKKLGIVIGVCVVAALALNVQADIGVRVRSSGGAYGIGGSWAAGPYPVNGSLIQLIWSPTDQSATPIGPTLVSTGEEVIWEGASQSYGYLFTPSGPHVKTELPANSGFVYARLFVDAAPALGGQYLTGPVVDGSTVPGYDGANPATWLDYNITPEGPAEMTSTVIPEPATLALWAVGALALALRRRK
jgi:hypothetical protein